MTYEEFQKELTALFGKFFGNVRFGFKFPFRIQIALDPNLTGSTTIGLQISIGEMKDLGDIANPDV